MNIQALSTNLPTTSGTSGTSLSQTTLSDTTQSSSQTPKRSSSDSVTISAQGLSMFQEAQTANSEALAAATDETNKDDNATISSLLSETTGESIEDSDDDTTTDLSSYTASQIQTLVSEGTITQVEATAELAKRSEGSDTQSSLRHIDVQA